MLKDDMPTQAQPEPKVRTFGKNLLNWRWFVRFEEYPDKSVKILAYWREHFPQAHSSFALEEEKLKGGWELEESNDNQRIVIGIWYEGESHTVRNQQNIFSYPDPLKEK